MNKLTTPIKLLVIATLITIIVATSTTLNDLLSTKPLTIDQYKALEDAIAYNSLKLFIAVLAAVCGITLLVSQWYNYLNVKDPQQQSSAPLIGGLGGIPTDAFEKRKATLVQKAIIDRQFQQEAEDARKASNMGTSLVKIDEATAKIYKKQHPEYNSLSEFYGPAIYELPLSDVKLLVAGRTAERKAILGILLSLYDMPEFLSIANKHYIHRILEEQKELE